MGRFVYAPARRVLPRGLALIVTFLVSGGIHDLVIMGIRRSAAFFFTTWFFLLGIGVVVGRAAGMDLSGRPWWARAGINLVYLVVCLALSLIARRILGIP